MSKIDWKHYIPLALIGFLSFVLLIGLVDITGLLKPIRMPIIVTRLTLLVFSVFGGIMFFGMVQLGFFVWKGTLFIINKVSRFIHERRSTQ